MKKVDRPFLVIVVILVVAGFFIFSSASLGLLAREGAHFSSVAFNQFFLGIVLGTLALVTTSRIHYRIYRKYALYFFIGTVLLTLLVFVPNLGLEFNGARRWIGIGPLSFQPAELLKLGFVIYLSAWLSGIKHKLHTITFGVLPLVILFAIVGAIMLAQPDTGTFLVIGMTGTALFIVAGARWRDISILAFLALCGAGVLAFFRPYIWERIVTFINPSVDPLGISYQIQQSLIAIGSGGLFGRGFGQSVQKFDFLPEPIGDSIFAVFAEEWGFVGSVALIGLFLFLAFRGFRIAERAPDTFGGLLALGIVILIVSQSLVNIAAMLGVLPLTGLPLLFVSHGGSALFLALAEVGIILNISKYQRK